MKEAIFNSEIVRSLRSHSAWAYKIPDMPQSMLVGARFNPEKPCDIVACARGRFIGIEGKQFKKYQAFGNRHIRPNQVSALNAMVEAGGSAYVLLNIRQSFPRLNRMIVFKWPCERLAEPKGSFLKNELLEMPYITGSRGHFDISGILDG